ncbi:MAG: 1,4-dihydroxy-2-naphthoate polyprenyltransferase [Desulfobacterales bacterium]|nr:1,4-dihydroxy-2-naphthoate polyprenyltransferase [Desulfobacterales bacterium]
MHPKQIIHTWLASPWHLAIRPKTLPASAAPVLVGIAAAIGDQGFSLLPALFALTGAMLLQIAVNLANDYFDGKSGVDGDDRLGPVRVTQSGLISEKGVFLAMIGCLVAAAFVGLYLIYHAGLPVLLIGLASVLGVLAYSAGPFPIASNGLGELFAFLFFGPVAVCGTYYVQALTLGLRPLAASIIPGLLVAAIMLVNNLRDIPTDTRAGKQTLAVRMGRGRASCLCALLVLTPFLLLPLFFLWNLMSIWGFGALASFPLVLPLIRDLFYTQGSPLNETLAGTARLSVLFSLLFAPGLLF